MWPANEIHYVFAPVPRPRVGDTAYLYRSDGLATTCPPPRSLLRRLAEAAGVKAPVLYVCLGTVVDTGMFDTNGMCRVLET
jgi:hypothetical protein